MAYSISTGVGNGTNTLFPVTFPYINKSHVKVYVTGVETSAFTWFNDSTIQLSSAPANGALIRIQRDTPKSTTAVDFTTGSMLKESTLDLNSEAMLYIVQEGFDSLEAAIGPTATLAQWDAEGKPLVNLADSAEDSAAVTNQRYNTVMLPAMQAIQAATQALHDQTSTLEQQTQALYDATLALRNAEQTYASQCAASAAAAAQSASDAAEIVATVPVNVESRLSGLETTVPSKLDKSLFTATWDFIVGSGPGACVKKTSQEVADALAGTSAGKLVQLDATGRLPALDARNLTRVADQLPRDNAAMNAFLSWLGAGRASGPVPNGYLWTFQTDEWNKTNAYYDAVGDYYTNTTEGTGGNDVISRPNPFNTSGGTLLDPSTTLPIAGNLTTAQFHTSTAGNSVCVKVFRLVSGTTYSYVGESQYVTTVSGVNTVTLTTPVAVQAGDVLGLHMTGAVLNNIFAAGGSTYQMAGDVTTTQTWTNNTSQITSLRGTVVYGPTNMDIQSPGVLLGYNPTKATIYLLHKAVDAVTLNTDIVVGASEITGWTWATDLEDLGTYNSDYKLLRATVALANANAGIVRAATDNNKAQHVRAVLAWFE